MRKIHIDNKVYKYKVGKSNIKIIFPDGKSIITNHSEVTGVSWTEIERFCWKNRTGFAIKPYEISNHILKMLGKTE